MAKQYKKVTVEFIVDVTTSAPFTPEGFAEATIDDLICKAYDDSDIRSCHKVSVTDAPDFHED